MDWNDAYSNYDYVSCAEEWRSGLAPAGEDFCQGFFARAGNRCVNTNIGVDANTTQRCFVSGQCRDLHGGAFVTKMLGIKHCVAGEGDDRLADKTVDELIQLSTQNQWDIGLVLKMSYATPWGTRWEVAKNYLKGIVGLTAGQMQELDAHRASGRPIVIDSLTGIPPWGVVVGRELYEVKMNTTYINAIQTLGHSLLEHPDRINYVTRIDIFEKPPGGLPPAV